MKKARRGAGLSKLLVCRGNAGDKLLLRFGCSRRAVLPTLEFAAVGANTMGQTGLTTVRAIDSTLCSDKLLMGATAIATGRTMAPPRNWHYRPPLLV
jgi:hypothetical protein